MPDTHTNPTRIGFWRPVDPNNHPASRIADLAESDASLASRGERVPTYVSPSDLRAEGVTTRVEYFQRRAVRARHRADEIRMLPAPEPDGLTPEERVRLADWLEAGAVVASYSGSSRCRVCGRTNGSEERSRDGYLYPSGLSHYVRDHGCRVPGLPGEI